MDVLGEVRKSSYWKKKQKNKKQTTNFIYKVEAKSMSPKSILNFSYFFPLMLRWLLFMDMEIFKIFWLHCMARGILVPWPGIEPAPPAMEAWCPNHRTTREVLVWKYFNNWYDHTVTYHTIISPQRWVLWIYSFDKWGILIKTRFDFD